MAITDRSVPENADDMTDFRWNVLYVLAGNGPMKGVALKAELEDYYEKEIYHGRMYPNLNTLVDRGLIDKEERDKRTNDYSLTQKGRRELRRRHQWQQELAAEVV